MKNGCSKLLDFSVLIVCLLAIALMYFFLVLIDGTTNIFENTSSLIMFCIGVFVVALVYYIYKSFSDWLDK